MHIGPRAALSVCMAMGLGFSPARGAVQADFSSDRIRLSGRVRSMAQREACRSALGTPGVMLIDHLVVEPGESSQWLAAFTGLLAAGAPALASGTILLDAGRLEVSGTAHSVRSRDELLRRAEAVRQPGLQMQISLAVLAPATAPWLEFAFSAHAPTLSGRIALPGSRERLAELFGGALRLEVDPGLPSAWETEVLARLEGLLSPLAGLAPGGTLHLAPGRAVLRGHVDSMEVWLRSTRLTAVCLGSAVRVENFLRVAGPAPGLPEGPAPTQPFPGPYRLVFSAGSSRVSPASRSTILAAMAAWRELPASARLRIRAFTAAPPGRGKRHRSEPERALARGRLAEVRRVLVEAGAADSRLEEECQAIPGGNSAPFWQVELGVVP